MVSNEQFGEIAEVSIYLCLIFWWTLRLKILNLSFNSIGELTNETFAGLFHLKHLHLRRMNISSIGVGTFTRQQKLISLTLSDNRLRRLDFQQFHPIQHDLMSLSLARNQLTEFANFRDSLFVQRLSLDIQRNSFNCSYLEYFMETFDWQKIEMPTDQFEMDKPNIRSINCDVSIYRNISNVQQSDDTFDNNHLLKALLIVSSAIIVALIVVVLKMSKKKLENKPKEIQQVSAKINQFQVKRIN